MADEQAQQTEETNMTDEEAILKIAQAMKDNAPSPDEKVNVHTFLQSIVQTHDTKKVGNLRDDKEYNELGKPIITVRGDLDMALISDKIMNNRFFKEYFEKEAENTLATSLSRDGFLVRQSTSTTKNVADVTKRIKRNKGMFKKSEVVTGGDPYSSQTSPNEQ